VLALLSQTVLTPESEFTNEVRGEALWSLELSLALEKLNFGKLRWAGAPDEWSSQQQQQQQQQLLLLLLTDCLHLPATVCPMLSGRCRGVTWRALLPSSPPRHQCCM